MTTPFLDAVPTSAPGQLSEPARDLYARSILAVAEYNAREVPVKTGTEDAAREIAAAGLGRYKEGQDGKPGALRVIATHPQFTVVSAEHTGVHGYRAVVEVPARRGVTVNEDDLVVLAVLDGATCKPGRDAHRAPASMVLATRHATATDFEHDTAYLAYLTLVNPGPLELHPWHAGRVSFWSSMGEARLYPFEVDYTTQSDEDTSAGLCDGESWCRRGQPHALIAFQPPVRRETARLAGALVKVTLYPTALALAEGAKE